VDVGGHAALIATHAVPGASLAELAQLRVVGRIRFDGYGQVVPQGGYAYVAMSPVFIAPGKIAVRCDFTVKGSTVDPNAGYGVARNLPMITSAVFLMPAAPSSSR
jgi:hypothetical protein